MNTKLLKELFNIVPKNIRPRTAIVGGFVRDYFLNIESNDIDFVVKDSSPKEMLKLGFTNVGNDFPVFLLNGHEFALCRQERKSSAGYNGFETVTNKITFQEDLLRRDLTINAMLIDSKGVFFDPFNGKEDLDNKILRHVSEAFAEDPVRVLRLARFTAKYKGFTIHEDTKKLAKSLKPELESLTPERVYKELVKVLQTDNPSQFFKTLKDLDLLDVLFPELFLMIGLKHNPRNHAEGDVFEHTMKVLDMASIMSKSINVRFAALYHDIGKPHVETNENFSFHGHETTDLVVEQFDILRERLRVPTDTFRLGLAVAINHHRIHRLDQLSYKALQRMLTAGYFPKKEIFLEEFIIAIDADAQGRIRAVGDSPRVLTEEEVNTVYRNGSLEIDNVIYSVPTEKVNKEFLFELLKVSKLKSKVSQEPNFSLMGVQAIKDFVLKEKYTEIKKLQKKHFKQK